MGREPRPRESFRIVVVGGGLAGAATAYHLALEGANDLLLLEAEDAFGVHSSGRNAAMIRQVVPDPEIAALARRGADWIGRGDPSWGEPVPFRRSGSLLLGRGPEWDALRADAAAARAAGLEVECLPPQAAVARVPVLRGAAFDGAVWTPGDGVVEIGPLLHGFLAGARARGAAVRSGERVAAIRRRGARFLLETERSEIEAEVVVDAAGAWADEIARLAGSAGLGLVARRRHLFLSAAHDWVDREWPFVWDVSAGLYFRPETGGLLLSACDGDPMPPGVPPLDPAVEERLAEKISAGFPAMPEIRLRTRWAGLRTFAPDGRFAIGWDPWVEGLFWVAGLGGHGVTCAYPAGELAARKILAAGRVPPDPFDPLRFARSRPPA